MPADARLEQGDECRFHQPVVVGDVEADHAGTQVLPETGGEPGAVHALHHEHDIGPAKQLGCDRIVGVVMMPADTVSTPGQSANTCSAVGLRKRFLPQMKRMFSGKVGSVAILVSVSPPVGAAWLRGCWRGCARSRN